MSIHDQIARITPTSTPRAPSAPMTDAEYLDAVARSLFVAGPESIIDRWKLNGPQRNAARAARTLLATAHAASTAALEAENANLRRAAAWALGYTLAGHKHDFSEFCEPGMARFAWRSHFRSLTGLSEDDLKRAAATPIPEGASA